MRISYNDLNGQTLMIMPAGDSISNGLLREEILKNCPSINLVDAPYYYDLETFNKADETNSLLITLDCWDDIHPAFTSIPLETDYRIPYGILYPKNPTKEITNFLKLID